MTPIQRYFICIIQIQTTLQNMHDSGIKLSIQTLIEASIGLSIKRNHIYASQHISNQIVGNAPAPKR